MERGKNTKNKLIAWFRDNFDTVKSENTASGYINVPRSMRLIEMTGGKLRLTPLASRSLPSAIGDSCMTPLPQLSSESMRLLSFSKRQENRRQKRTSLSF